MSASASRVVGARLVLADQVLAWTARNAIQAGRQGNPERAAQWAELGGRVTGQFGSAVLAHAAIETVLREALPAPRPILRQQAGGVRWLHVFSESYKTGGHTALARRWVSLDPSEDRHDLVLTSQTVERAATGLLAAIRERGGEATSLLPACTSLTGRAQRLRELAEAVDAVVLHVHPWDTIPVMAFGHPGGPPVFLLNHADHLFWFGGSVADAVLNIRPSGEDVCTSHRGVHRSLRLPLPLPEPPAKSGDEIGRRLRASLQIPPDAIVYLTIGTRFKYLPIEGFSFLEAAAMILERSPNAYLVAVGPSDDEDGWPGLKSRFGARLNAVGAQVDIQPYLAAADVYLEGFPFGSLTAMLEAVMAGLPPVLAPAKCPLPYRSDDFGLTELPVADDVSAYVALATELGDDANRRHGLSARCAELVRHLHCVPEWAAHLEALRERLRQLSAHGTYPLPEIEPMDSSLVHYWAAFSQSGNFDNAFSWVFRAALDRGLRPRVDRALHKALAGAAIAGVNVVNPWTAMVGSHVLAMLPHGVAQRAYRST